MASISFKFVATLVVPFLFCALQTIDAQGTCTCIDGTATGTDTSDAVSNCPITMNCDAGFECPTPTCAISDILPAISGPASVTCGNIGPQTCIAGIGVGTGDPHLAGFDGSKFHFHGIHKKNYVVFGQPSGDILVTKMKETQRLHHASGAKATFFDEFGLQIADSNDHVKVYLARNNLQGGHWLPKVELNGKEIKESVILMSSRVKFRPGEKWVSIITKDSKFIIFAGRPEDEDLHHLNLKIILTRPPPSSARYLGILGVTLNHALGHDIHPDLDATGRAETLETAMRGRFEVQSLFPHRSNGHDIMLSGVIRTLSDIKHIEKTWSAGTV